MTEERTFSIKPIKHKFKQYDDFVNAFRVEYTSIFPKYHLNVTNGFSVHQTHDSAMASALLWFREGKILPSD